MVIAFGMNLMVVFDSTDTGMRLAAGGFDPMATSVVALGSAPAWSAVQIKMSCEYCVSGEKRAIIDRV